HLRARDRGGLARSRDGSPALGGRILRDVCAVEVESLNVEGVVRERSANGDRGSETVENTVAGANDQLPAERSPGNTEPGTEVSLVVVNPIGEDSCSGKAGAGIEHGRLGDQVELISEAEVQSEVIPYAPFVLGEGRLFLEIGRRAGAGGARAGDGFGNTIRGPGVGDH